MDDGDDSAFFERRRRGTFVEYLRDGVMLGVALVITGIFGVVALKRQVQSRLSGRGAHAPGQGGTEG